MRLAPTIALLVGCASAPAPVRVAIEERVAPDIETARASVPAAPAAALRDLHVQCRSFDSACTGSVGMLARDADPAAQRCTASLVAADRVLTASHCLRPTERRAGARCDGEWIAFPAVEGHEAEWVPCAEVERADGVDDVAVMRRDVAILRLARPLDRPPLVVDPRPPEEGSIVTVVALRPHPIYDLQHEIEGRLCRVASASSAVDTFGREASRVGWLMSCPSRPGSSGSPVLDARGRIRALMHAGSDPAHGVGVTSGL